MAGFFRSALGLVNGSGTDGIQSDFVGRTLELDNRTLRVKKSVAEGGFGVVFLVQDESSKEKFALKRMLAFDKATCKAVSREVSLMKQVSGHENVVPLITAVKGAPPTAKSGSAPTEFLLLMEYCPTGDLGKVLNQRGRLGPAQVLSIFRQVCQGVEHLHAQQKPIIHRDIKVENFLVTDEGKIKLCDFGSATTRKVQPSKLTYQQICAAEEEMEKNTTPQSRTPEMLDMHTGQDIDEKADVWALGCVLYTLCFRRHPFEDSAKLAITNARYDLPEESDHQVFHDLIRILLCPTAKNRPSVTGVLERLKVIEKLIEPTPDSPLVALSPVTTPTSAEPSFRVASFLSKAVDGASSLMAGAKAKSTNLIRSGMIKDTVRHGGAAGDLDLTYITPKIIAMSRPADSVTLYRNGITELCDYFRSVHLSKVLIVNVDDRGYDASKFDVKVAQFGWKNEQAPTLDRLFMMAKSVHEWLTRDEKHVVAFHCEDGKGRTGTAVAAYMVYCKLFSSYKDALRLFHLKRMSGAKRVISPSQERYVAYLGEVIGLRPPHKKGVTINAVLLSSIPTFNTRQNGCRPYVEVFMNNECIKSTQSENLTTYTVGSDNEIEVPLDLTVLGDVRIVLHHASHFMGGISTTTQMCSVQFHTGFVQGKSLSYSRSQIEGGNARKRFDHEFRLKLDIKVLNAASEQSQSADSWDLYPQSAHASERGKGRHTCFFSQQEAETLLGEFAVLARAFSDRVTGSDAGEDPQPEHMLSDSEDDMQDATIVEESSAGAAAAGANMLLDLSGLGAPAPTTTTSGGIATSKSASSLLDLDPGVFGAPTPPGPSPPAAATPAAPNSAAADLLADFGGSFSQPTTPLQSTFPDDLFGSLGGGSSGGAGVAAPDTISVSSNGLDFLAASQPTTPVTPSPAQGMGMGAFGTPLQAQPAQPSMQTPTQAEGDPFATLGSLSGVRPRARVPMGQMPRQQQPSMMQQQQQHPKQPQAMPQATPQPRQPKQQAKPAAQRPAPVSGMSAKGPSFDDLLSDHFSFSTKPAEKEPETLKDMVREQKKKTEDPIKLLVEEWMEGKESNIRAVISTLHEVLWEGARWKPMQLHELLTENQVKKGYQKAVRVIHPDKNGGSVHKDLAKELFYSVQEAYETWEESPHKNMMG